MKLSQITKFSLVTVLLFLIISCSSSNNLAYKSVKNSTDCLKKEGYWYNNKCWKEFDDDGIDASKIDSTVISQMKVIEKSTYTFGNNSYPLVAFLPIEEKEGMLFIAVYGTKDKYHTLLIPTNKKNIKNGIFNSDAMLFKGDALSGDIDEDSVLIGTASINVIDLEDFKIEISGEIVENNVSKKFSFIPNEAVSGAGNSVFEVKGTEVYLSGDLGTITYWQLKNLIKNHPEVQTIVMTTISGSVNDAVNMHTGRLVRENGFTTKVLSTSDIASGGVDLFCAGKNRIVEQGAKIGIHSWCCVNDLTAQELPKDHPAHKYQLEYFTMALGAVKGPAFYFRTLEAAPFDDVHYMSDEEIKEWDVATEFIEKK